MKDDEKRPHHLVEDRPVHATHVQPDPLKIPELQRLVMSCIVPYVRLAIANYLVEIDALLPNDAAFGLEMDDHFCDSARVGHENRDGIEDDP